MTDRNNSKDTIKKMDDTQPRDADIVHYDEVRTTRTVWIIIITLITITVALIAFKWTILAPIPLVLIILMWFAQTTTAIRRNGDVIVSSRQYTLFETSADGIRHVMIVDDKAPTKVRIETALDKSAVVVMHQPERFLEMIAAMSNRTVAQLTRPADAKGKRDNGGTCD